MTDFSKNSRLAAYRSISAHGAVAGADPHRLVQMVMDAILERLATARACIERGESVRKAGLLHSCVILIAELRGSLDVARGGPLAQNLNDLYDYMIRRLIQGNLASDVGSVAEVFGLLGDIRGAWAAIGPEVRGQAAATASAA